MVAMNAETYRKDHAEVAAGGYLIYDSTWPRSQLFNRTDIHILGVPLSRICNENFDNARSRILMKNIMYVGVLAALLDLDMSVIKQLLNEQFASEGTPAGCQPEGHRSRVCLREGALLLPLAVSGANARQDPRSHHDRRQHHGGAWLPVRRCHGGRLVPHHAVHLADGCLQDFLREVPQGSGNGQGQLLHHPGRGRTRRHRHGAGRQLEWRAVIHADQRAGNLADERVPRLWLLHGNSRRHLRRAALRPVHRHADAHPAGRSDGLRLRIARRHAPRAAVPGESGRGVLPRRAGLRPGRAAADAGHRADRPRYRHERLDVPRPAVG